ncbi:MAG: hypothetical protein JKX81_15805 [Arenicella sp.]|nr:hypothetical protein [Arenicella sp.]
MKSANLLDQSNSEDERVSACPVCMVPKHVYELNYIVIGADPESFYIPERGWPAQDKNNVYRASQFIDCPIENP